MSNRPKIFPRVRRKLDERGVDVALSKRGTFVAAVAAVVVGIAGIVLTLLNGIPPAASRHHGPTRTTASASS
jgi:uncharacterized membrane protein